jgi:DNA replicative helicase MCM subunit Mcm2 (Cdc46/Mcm family)
MTQQTFECPECQTTLNIPTEPAEGQLECEKCESVFLYGKNEPSDGPSLEMVSEYYSFIAPEVIALQEKILLFNEQNPDSKLFTQEALDSATTTIEEAKKMLKEEEDESN